MAKDIHLLIVDPQNDFCDLPDEWLPADPMAGRTERLRPQLAVPGAHEDMLRLSDFIRIHGEKLSDITVTLDSHHHVGIERPAFWVGPGGADVAPFTPITAAQVRAGDYLPRDPALLDRVLAYLDALESAGRYTHMVWPAHCEIGSWGHGVHAAVQAAYNSWESRRAQAVGKILKGQNPLTEHYSAVKAEVPDPDDPDTDVNRMLLGRLESADVIVVAGEAGSHCVRATTEHLLEYLDPGRARQLVLLGDCISPVTGFEREYEAFLAAMSARGVRTVSVCDFDL